MATKEYVIKGWDPTANPAACIARSELADMVDKSQPQTDVGFVLVADTASAPDVATYPELARFLWLETSSGVPTGNVYYYNGSAWVQITAKSTLVDYSVTISKLLATGGTEGDIITVDSASHFQFITIPEAVKDRTLPVIKLTPGQDFDVLYCKLQDGFVTPMWGGINDVIADGSLSKLKTASLTLTVTPSGGNLDIDASQATSYYVSLGADIANLSITNLRNGDTINVRVQQLTGNSWNILAYASDIYWPNGGTAPTITPSPTVDVSDLLSFTKVNDAILGTFLQDYQV